MGGGVFGVEGDFGFSPDFYGKTDVGGSNVFTATGNLLIGIPFGGQQGFGIRLYGVVGAGLLKSKSDFGTDVAEIDENDVTWSAGGGVLMFFGNNAGIRFDIRYFRTFNDLEILGVSIAESPGKIDFTRSLAGFRAEVLTLTATRGRQPGTSRAAPASFMVAGAQRGATSAPPAHPGAGSEL